MPPIMFIMGPIPQAPIILGSGQTRFVANFLWKILFQRQATIHLQLLKSTVLFYRFQSQNHDAHIFTMPSTLPKCSKDTSVKVDDMSIATPKKVTKSWKPVKIWRKHHLYHPGNTFLFFWGVLYITSVYFTWYILLYRAKPQKNQFPYLPNFEFCGLSIFEASKTFKNYIPQMAASSAVYYMDVSNCLSADKSPAMDN